MVAKLLLLPLLLQVAVAEDVTFSLGDMGEITGRTTQTKIYGDAPYDDRTYYRFRNLFYADSVSGDKRFSQPVMRTEPYAQAGGAPYDATRTGPLCSQAGLDSELIEGLKTKTVKEMLIETLPEGLIPDILMGLFVPALLDAIEDILEVPRGTLEQNKLIHDVLYDWLDIDISTNEDCLHLAVSTPWRPDGTEKKDLPVMFFIHGGAFTGGMQIRMGAERLGAWGDVVVVAINYRLALLGFMCLDTDQAAGNMGMLDMVVALEWVHKHIGYFGGDASRITIFGESAGSASIGHLLLSDSTNGLFSQGIGQSGSALSSWAFDKNPEFHSRNIAEKTGCTDENVDDLVSCLKLLPVESITTAAKAYISESRNAGGLGFGGLIPCAQTKGERKFYTQHETPTEKMHSGDYESVPILFGANKHEGSFVYATVYNTYITNNSLTEDSGFLKYDLIPQLLRTVQMENSYGIEHLLDDTYFDLWQLGDLMDMQAGLVDLLGVFFIKASSYTMVKENSKLNPSYWYSFDYVAEHKTAFHALFMSPEKKANVTPGVCHGDELLYLFDAELPLAFCDVSLLSADASACLEDTGNALGDLNNAISCLTSESGTFRSKWSDCLTGRLNAEELTVSANIAQMWTNFAINGEPGFGLEPWSKENPWFVSIKDTMSIESDYAMTYNIAKEEARTTPSPNSDSCESSPAGATTANPHPGIYCADGWDLYTYSFEGEEHHSCFWFGNPDEMVSHSNAKQICESMNSALPEVPNGPNLNHWLVDQLLQKHNKLTSEGKSRAPVADTQYWLGATKVSGDWVWENRGTEIQWYDWGDNEPTNNSGESCLTYMLYRTIWGFEDFKWNDWNCDSAADFICERRVD